MPRPSPIVGLLLLAAAGVAHAGDDTTPQKPVQAEKPSKWKGPDIRWAPTWNDAAEEAGERNVPMMIHSHASTCGPCKALHEAIFHDADYVAWANGETVHVLSYSIDAEADKPEPLLEVERDGEKVKVLAQFPMFRPEETEVLLAELNTHVKYPKTTPWTGVVDSTGKVLAERKSGTAAQFREMYEAEQKKMGAFLPRRDWLAVRAALTGSSDAEAAEDWKKATHLALDARALRKDFPPAVEERVVARLATLAAEAKRRRADAEKEKDPARRAAALSKVDADFAGLPPPK
jgi:hypothetical protein